MQQWVRTDLPFPQVNYYLVYRPGEIGPNQLKIAHLREQAEAVADEQGGVPVLITLIDDPTGVDEYVALAVRNELP